MKVLLSKFVVLLMVCCSLDAQEKTPESAMRNFCLEAFALSGLQTPDSSELENDEDIDFDIVRDWILNDEISPDIKRALLNTAYDNLGLFSPGFLAMLGCSYVALYDFDKGAQLIVGGIFREEIDVRLTGDKSCGSEPSYLAERVAQIIKLCQLSESDKESFSKAKQAAFLNFQNWDQSVSRDYKFDEVVYDLDEGSDLTKEEENLIVSRFYREIYSDKAPEILEGEDFLADEEDHFFFDLKNRIYYANDSSGDSCERHFSFSVPRSIIPKLSRFGEYEGEFQLSGLATLDIDYHWSSYQAAMFENAYEDAYLRGEQYSDHMLTKFTLDGRSAFREQFSSTAEDGRSTLINRTCFQVGKCLYEFEANYTKDEEAHSLKDLEMVFDSLKFLKE